MLRKQLDLVRQGGRVQRFHGKPLIMQENVAEHSFTVAWVVALYCEATGGKATAELLLAALQHDLAEAVVGDIPSPTKRALGTAALDAYEAQVLRDHGITDYAAALGPRDHELLKWGDNLSGYMKCLQEISMGNRYIERSLRNYHAYLVKMIETSEFLDKGLMKRMMDACEGETDVHS